MTIIGVISDTHINPGGRRHLPARVFAAFAAVDMILHAGDLNTLRTVRDLEVLAPVHAVIGNNDDMETVETLPGALRIEVEECVIGLVHGDQCASRETPSPLQDAPGNRQTAANALTYFEDADCIVFGHSHRPLIKQYSRAGRAVLLFNPGSPTDKRWGPHHAIGLLRVDGKRIEAELIEW